MLGQHVDETKRLKTALVPPFDQAFWHCSKTSNSVADCRTRWWWSPRSSAARRGSTAGQVGAITGDTCSRWFWRAEASAAASIHGASDPDAAYPVEGFVSPADLTATIFNRMGHAPDTEIRDPLGRPIAISRGEVIRPVVM